MAFFAESKEDFVGVSALIQYIVVSQAKVYHLF